MSRQKGSANFAGTIEVQAGGPLDARSVVGTVADLTASATFDYVYEGMQVYCKEDKKTYKLIGNDPTVSANWAEVGGGESGTTDYEDLDNKPSINGVSLIGNKTSSDLGIEGGSIQVDEMPTASADIKDTIVEYTGATNSTYTNGYFYKCVDNSEPIGVPVLSENSNKLIYKTSTGASDAKYLGFDGNDSTYTQLSASNYSLYTPYYGYIFDSPIYVKSVKVIYAPGGGGPDDYYESRTPNILVQGSNDGSSWTTIGTLANPLDPNTNGVYTREIQVNAETAYSQIRVYWEDRTNVNHSGFKIYTMEINGTTEPTSYSWVNINVQDSSGGGHTILDPEDTEMTQRANLKFGGDFDVSDDSENDTTEVAPHELTNADMAEIMSTLPGSPVKGVKYSTEEQVIGEWIDGKPLYQKTYHFTNLIADAATHEMVTLANTVTVVDIKAFQGDSAWGMSLPYNQTGNYVAWVDIVSQKIRWYTKWDNASISNLYITLRYTKTTDTPQ